MIKPTADSQIANIQLQSNSY